MKSRIAVLLAAVAASPLVLVPDANPAAGTTTIGRAPVRSDPALQTLPLAGPAARAATAGPIVAGLPPRVTKPFSLLGVTWTDPRAALDAPVRVRTRAVGTGRWSAWRALESDGAAGGDQRGASDPLWVGASDAIEARVGDARRVLPAGLRLDLINPDALEPAPPAGRTRSESGRTRFESARARSESGRAAVPLPTRPVPRMITRAGWGANEAIVKDSPEYTGRIELFFVHHTATGNGYSCADSARIVRGIQAYQVRSRGWDDLGYNFLVDKCGTIFEGRGGGVGRSVLGAHTLGFNSNASAIAVIGNFDSVGVAPRVRTAIATVAAYKLGAFGNAPAGRVMVTSGGGNLHPKGAGVTLDRISGHRDAGRTACPGDALYAQLPAVRALAGAAPAGLRLVRMTGAARYGRLLFTKGLIRPLWNVRTPSALINRFEVWVDGRLTLATPGTHRTTALRLAPGGHTVTVRALHLSGRTREVTSTIVSDPTAPVFAARPEVVLRQGSLDGSVPVRLGWAATDVNGLSSVTLLRPTRVELGTAARGRNGTVRPAVPTTFALRAVDRAGNAVDASVTRTAVVLSETAARKTGSWRTLRGPAYLGGVALGAAAGSSASWTFTGRSAALAVSRGTGSGRVRIWVDGTDQGVVDLRSPATMHRQAVWSRWWSQSGSHTVRVQVEGTTGGSGVVLDGLVYLR